MNLETPIAEINKIAAENAAKFKKLGIENIKDLLTYYPFRYDDYSNLLKIKDIVPGTLITVKGKIELFDSRRSFKRRMLVSEAIVSDETGQVKVVWFNQRYLPKILSVGDEIYLSGKAISTENSTEFSNPTFEKVNKYDKFTAHTARIVPVYSTTEKLSQRQIRFLVKRTLAQATFIREWLPNDIIKSAGLMPLSKAVEEIHFPSNDETLEKARYRLKFDEIFILQTRAALSKQELFAHKAKKIEFKEKETKHFVKKLPFEMTASQKKSAWEILKDLAQEKPTNRLLEGDVGSGKTITAALGIYNALLNGVQVAYMAPTEILASQQYASFLKLFDKFNFNISLLTRSEIKFNGKDVKKTEQIKLIKEGGTDLIIGTHALIQDSIEFKDLNMVVVDEQHRFGVSQRKALKDKSPEGYYPHLLSMTATPIPRSLALTLYGDLDLSVIDEMPKDRKPIETKVVEPHDRKGAYAFIESEIAKGHQVFVVCPLIDPSDKTGSKAVKQEFERLDKEVFKKIPIGLLHGKLKAVDKDQVMQDFVAGSTKILVSTTVVEVGIDVPNATCIMIESAERFGLAQLHQLRGRVGRSSHQSYCFLFTESDTETTLKRLQALVTSSNGFELAEKDLEFRGPGEVYGMRQSGYFDSLKIAKLTDWPVIKKVKPAVDALFKVDPKLSKFPSIKEKIKEFELNIHFE